MFNLCFIPTSQCVIIFGASFYYHQLIIIAILTRLIITSNITIKLNKIDILFIIWQVSGFIIYVIQWQTVQAAVWKTGRTLEALTTFALIRLCLKNKNDIYRLIDTLAIISIIMAPFVLYESISGHNPFSLFGKVSTDIREGRFRCQAAFPISIILGIFWALFISLFWMRYKQHNSFFYILSIACSLFMIYACASSTPIGTLLFCCIVIATYKYKQWYRLTIPLCILLYLILSFIMVSPPYYIIARIGVVGGSTAWHRAYLIDRAIIFFNEWAMLGTRTTSHWNYTGRSGHEFDITNQFILEGIRGGAVTLIFFIVLIYYSCKTIYRTAIKEQSSNKFYWNILAFLSGHIVSFFGISYFGQMTILLYTTFAIISLLHNESSSYIAQDNNLKVLKTYNFRAFQ